MKLHELSKDFYDDIFTHEFVNFILFVTNYYMDFWIGYINLYKYNLDTSQQ